MNFRNANSTDYFGIALTHERSLPSDVTSTFGQQFLLSVFVPTIVQRSVLTVVAVGAQGVNGYVAFGDSGLILRKCFAEQAAVSVRGLLGSIFTRGGTGRAISIARYIVSASMSRNVAPQLPAGQETELMWIAVHPSMQGRGIGGELLETGVEELRSLGYRSCWVKTLTSTPQNIDFYKQHAFVLERVIAGRAILRRTL